MEFSNWLSLHELFDVQNMDTSNVELEPVWGGYVRHVDMPDGNVLTVEMGQGRPVKVGYQTVSDIWTISFSRNKQYRLAQGETNPYPYYAEVFKTLKKLMETLPVNGFSWLAFTDRTIPIYEKFLTRMLPDFVRVSQTDVVRKDVVEKALDKMNPYDREIIQKGLSVVQGDYRSHVNDLASRKGAHGVR